MKILVVYSSKTGGTKKVADAVKACCEEWDIIPVDEIETIEKYDLIFVGGWIDKGCYDAKTLAFIEKIHDKKIAFFFTLGAYPTSKHAYECVNSIAALFEKNGNKVLNHFHCQSAIDEKLIAWMKGLGKDHPHAPDKYREWRWADAAKHPNNEDFRAAENFADVTRKLYQKEMNSNV